MSVYSSFNPRKTRNIIDNGNFAVAQTGQGPYSPGQTVDRWRLEVGPNSSVGQVSAVTGDGPTPNSLAKLELNCTTQKQTYGATEYIFMDQYIEGWNFVPLIGKTTTLSFWVKATTPGIYSIALRNSAYDRAYVKEYTINSSNTWEYKTINIVFDFTDGNWNLTNGFGLNLIFNAGNGPTYATSTLGQWITGNIIGSTNQTAFSQAVGNKFSIAQVQLELGNFASPFEVLNFQVELEKAFRHFERKYALLTSMNVSNGAGVCYFNLEYFEKRAVPSTINFSSPQIYHSSGFPWRNTTSTLYNAVNAYTRRALCIWSDANNSDYTSGMTCLVQGTFDIYSIIN